MNQNFKRTISGLAITSCLLGGLLPGTAVAENNFTYGNSSIYLNGQQLKGANPIVINGTTYLPLRSIGEAMSIQVNWNGTNNRIDLNGDFDVNTVALNKTANTNNGTSIYLNGQQLKGASSTVVNGTTYLPLRSIGEAMNIQVNWNKTNNRIDLNGDFDVDTDALNKTANTNTASATTADNNSATSKTQLISAPTNSHLLPFAFERNSVDGLKLCWLANNNTGKTINYYTVRLYFYNPVGDPAYDEITHLPYKDAKYVGPVAPGGQLAIYNIVGYVPACSKIVMGETTLTYSDGTKAEFWYGYSAYRSTKS